MITMRTPADVIAVLGRYVTSRSEEIHRCSLSGEFGAEAADARQRELLLTMDWLRTAMLAEVAAARDAAERLGGEVE